jgi:hypothetical protein
MFRDVTGTFILKANRSARSETSVQGFLSQPLKAIQGSVGSLSLVLTKSASAKSFGQRNNLLPRFGAFLISLAQF